MQKVQENTNNDDISGLGASKSLMIMTSIEEGDCQKVQTILQSKDLPQNTKKALLYKSITLYCQGNKNQFDILKELLYYGCNPNEKFKLTINGKTKEYFQNISSEISLLSIACVLNDFELVKLLLDYNALPSENKTNCLFFLFKEKQISNDEENKLKIIKKILEKNKKLDINEVDQQTGNTLLIESVKNNFFNIAKYLIDQGADINSVSRKDGNSVMHFAVMKNNKDLIEYLLKNPDCNLNIKNNQDESALSLTLKNSSQTDIYRLLVEKYQKISEESNQLGKIDPNLIKKLKKDNIYSQIEVKFNFKDTLSSSFDGSKKTTTFSEDSEINESLQNLGNYIQTQTPTLCLDLSTEEGQRQLVNESLQNENENLFNLPSLIGYENYIEGNFIENNKLKIELNSLVNEIADIEDKAALTSKAIKEEEYNYNKESTRLKEKIRCLEQELETLELLNSQIAQRNIREEKDEDAIHKYLENKFNSSPFEEGYIIKCLNQDLKDFQKFTKEQMLKRQPIINNLVKLFQNIVDSTGFDYNVQVFGSYKTGLSLPWSELDLLLVPNKMHFNKGSSILQCLYIKLQEIKFFSPPKLIENNIFPFIALKANEKYDNLSINISYKDSKHTGIQCVEYMKKYLEAFKILEPLNLAIKQILKNTNLLYYYVRNILYNIRVCSTLIVFS